MRFAVTDIETIGSAPGAGTITEIAICIHDGTRVIERFESLVNPEKKLPPFIVQLTGITDSMLRHAPLFADIADEVHDLLKDCVFVAHNVNFDFGFIKAEFDAVGIAWKPKRICTVRLARKSFPGHRKYGLASVCEFLDIPNRAAHRAMGDAEATAILFTKCIEAHGFTLIDEFLKHGASDAFLPNHIPADDFELLPQKPGVYYFQNSHGENIYIGKAINIKKRVRSHFTPGGGERQQRFLQEITHIDFKLCGTELIAQLVEDAEIRKYFPKYNRAQKRKSFAFHVVPFTDQRGLYRLQIQRGKAAGAYKSFSSMKACLRWLSELKEEFNLAPRWIGLHAYQDQEIPENIEEHNQQLHAALEHRKMHEPSYLIVGGGRNKEEQSVVYVHQGQLMGVGFVDQDQAIQRLDQVEDLLSPLPSSEITPYLLRSIVENPKGCIIRNIPV
jgi:DNA polymerase-3 subunit epsilon